MTIRTRVAPSPTGDPHVGTAYMSLFNYCFAKGRGGQFLVRIEDTDRQRSHPASEQAILDSLRWLGLPWDEGPDVGGPHGPYRQSERLPIYREHVDRLLAAGHAYRCFETPEELEAMRKEQIAKNLPLGYDRRARNADPDEAARRAAKGEPHTVRMKVPLDGECIWTDVLRGEIKKDWASIDDQIIMKSDGFPTYHLAVVVDDHLMRITHVLRGEEWINSTPKHLELYRMFGWEPPVHCHMPLLRNPDKSKLSKRKNPTSITYYRRAGFLPEALLNFLALAGWRPKDEEEKFTVARMTKELELEQIALGGPVFDVEKLRWLNGRYLREDKTPEQYVQALVDWAYNTELFARIAPMAQPRTDTLADWSALTEHFFRDAVAFDPKELTIAGKDTDTVAEILQVAGWELEKLRGFDVETLKDRFTRIATGYDLKLKDLLRPFYVAVSGRPTSTPLFDTMAILGSDITRVRIRRALDALGGISKKRIKEVEAKYRTTFDDAGETPA
jgi:glutamyl-tRNA synthetase